MLAVKLNEHLTYKKILKATILPILLMVFTSIYGIVDGFCVAFFSKEDAFAGLNLIFPAVMVIGCIGFLFGSGGSALIGKYLGEKKIDQAKNAFTNIILFATILGTILSVVGCLCVKPIAEAMGRITDGTTDGMIKEAIKYGRVIMLGQVLFWLQAMLSQYLYIEERPDLSFIFALSSGVTNIILDFVFVGAFDLGVIGAASATIVGYAVGTFGPLIYFLFSKKRTLSFVKLKVAFKDIGQTMFNGLSEFASNVSAQIMAVVFNILLLYYYGQIGVSAYGALMYLSFLFSAIFFGFSSGIAPFISYMYGEQNLQELRSILNKSLFIIFLFGLMMSLSCLALSVPLGYLFSSGNPELANLTTHGSYIFCASFFFAGFSIFISGWFTALNNGAISTLVSLLRCFVIQGICLVVLPILIGKEGVWICLPASEFLSAISAVLILLKFNKKYSYFDFKALSRNKNI